jgi:hypothetical protein
MSVQIKAGLRASFCLQAGRLKDNAIALPSIKHEKKLPIIPSGEEVKRLLKTPSLLKHNKKKFPKCNFPQQV